MNSSDEDSDEEDEDSDGDESMLNDEEDEHMGESEDEDEDMYSDDDDGGMQDELNRDDYDDDDPFLNPYGINLMKSMSKFRTRWEMPKEADKTKPFILYMDSMN